MTVTNFGSVNIDHVYQMEHFVAPGETVSCIDLNHYCGGKGLNQSIALRRSGVNVRHAGCIGYNGEALKEKLMQFGVDCSKLMEINGDTGHTIIQVDKKGQNKILLYGGTNQKMTMDYVDRTLADFGKGDILLVQNETNLVAYIIERASERGLKTVFNAAPISNEVINYPLRLVDWLIVNGSVYTGEFIVGMEPSNV